MRAAVLGCGAVGSRVARKLASLGLEVVAVDVSEQALSSLEGVEKLRLDASRQEELAGLLKKVDVACDCLPGSLGFRSMEAAAKVGAKLVSASYTPEDPLSLGKAAQQNGALIIPDCGLAPGLSNILAGRAYAELNALTELHVKVGSIPSSPSPPLSHASTWNIDDLLDEYLRPARIVRGGKVVKVDPLSTIHVVWIEGLGLFEAFYTDGLRTMLNTIKAREMDEATLRHRGHLASMRALAQVGLLSQKRPELKKLLSSLLREAWKGSIDDLLVLRVDASGAEGRRSYSLVLFDPREPPLLKATALVCSYIALAVVEGRVEKTGVLPPELLSWQRRLLLDVLRQLEAEGLKIEEGPRSKLATGDSSGRASL
ncbi:MAG: saccharopine dehydrogenase NADP-binding domain-containing protein [Candidatus Nezhaarchaeota archaeon]|nr:saccharopine dehydrogenase NADP-binding domain-containing protein [Candidatus Nezhaarchaeota archaeon]